MLLNSASLILLTRRVGGLATTLTQRACKSSLASSPMSPSVTMSRTFFQKISSPVTQQTMSMSTRATVRGVTRTIPLSAAQRNKKILIASLAGAGVIAIGVLGGSIVKGVMSSSSFHDNTVWPKFVQERVANTFGAFGVSVVLTGLSTFGLFRMGLAGVMARAPIVSMLLAMGGMFATSMAVEAIDPRDVGAKFAALAAFNVCVGAVLSPFMVLGGALLLRAALVTGGIVGSLSFVAANSPSDTFLFLGGPLAMGLGGLCVMNIAALFIPAVAASSIVQAVSVYGGLALFSGFVLYDTVSIVEHAKMDREYDAVSRSLSIFMDAVNIFIRVVMIMSGSSRKK